MDYLIHMHIVLSVLPTIAKGETVRTVRVSIIMKVANAVRMVTVRSVLLIIARVVIVRTVRVLTMAARDDLKDLPVRNAVPVIMIPMRNTVRRSR